MTSNLFPSLFVSVNSADHQKSDVYYALLDLRRLTTMMVGFMGEMNFGTAEDRNHDLEAAFSLAKIVSDQVHLVSVLAKPLDGPSGPEGD